MEYISILMVFKIIFCLWCKWCVSDLISVIINIVTNYILPYLNDQQQVMAMCVISNHYDPLVRTLKKQIWGEPPTLVD